jgi:putative lipoprotein
MRTVPRAWRTVAAAAAALTLVSCASVQRSGWVELNPEPVGQAPSVEINGTVHHLDVEGGVYVIRDAEGTTYNPTNLPGAFQVEGMAVEASARRRDDLASIGMVGPIVDLVRIRARNQPTPPPSLWGTGWVLEDLNGAAVIGEIPVTLQFSEDGAVSGTASCNQFLGSVTVSGTSITFGPLVTTRKMCAQPTMDQETRYLAALREAERFEVNGGLLYIHIAGQPQPLRFTGSDETPRGS